MSSNGSNNYKKKLKLGVPGQTNAASNQHLTLLGLPGGE
jgi:hypothetical protein